MRFFSSHCTEPKPGAANTKFIFLSTFPFHACKALVELPCGRSPRHRLPSIPQPLFFATNLGWQRMCVSEVWVQAHCRGNPRPTSCSRCLGHSLSLGVGALRDRPNDGNVCQAAHLCLQRCREFGRAARQSEDQWLWRSRFCARTRSFFFVRAVAIRTAPTPCAKNPRRPKVLLL